MGGLSSECGSIVKRKEDGVTEANSDVASLSRHPRPLALRLLVWQLIVGFVMTLWSLDNLDSKFVGIAAFLSPIGVSLIIWFTGKYHRLEKPQRAQRRRTLIVITVLALLVSYYVLQVGRWAMRNARDIHNNARQSLIMR
jgi:hypothetical protein